MLPQTLKSQMNIPNIANGQMRTKTPIQSHSKFLKTIQPVRKTVNFIHHSKMNRKPETRGFKGGFIPTELKSTDTKGQNSKSATLWQGSSDREESLSDPRWHKRPPTKGKKANTNSPKQSNTESTTKIHEAREVITKKKTEETRQNSNFSKTIFTDNRGEQTNQTDKKAYHGTIENEVLPEGNRSNLQFYSNKIIWGTKIGR